MGFKCIAFVDGACSKNGKVGAKASFAVFLVGGIFGNDTVIRGPVEAATYSLRREQVPAVAVAAEPVAAVAAAEPVAAAAAPRIVADRPECAPTNNRGELLAMVWALKALLVAEEASDVEIVSDSKITVMTLLEWYPNRLAKGTEHELKNLDLITVAWELLEALRKRGTQVKITHVRSHQRAPPATAPQRERLLHGGNAAADAHAAAAKDVVELIGAAAAADPKFVAELI